ncbi:hypothetical protein FH508_0016230 [Lysinibacillus sp. CD3-6]|uniref:hypothetical protein n=1 Tax=Lysinibacillus sp. CD3-6 TaxID=2892541 RepID=UPI00116C066C|nr:hypothetical protein [Lysinibacillus sp. CD3-6]UED78991.1 hypothetical protein FH508_0016230 [Lysinibacillus sp. CD3-6]
MTKFYMMNISKRSDDSEGEEMNQDKVFEKKSELKEFLINDGYIKESKDQYIKMHEETIYIATVEKIKVK